MRGQCHCGAVSIRVPSAPSMLNRCSCSICRRYGALWGYFSPDEVEISGPTDTYIWGDRTIAFHRCTQCGVLTHWLGTDRALTKMGVNMQNIEPAILIGVPVKDPHTSSGAAT